MPSRARGANGLPRRAGAARVPGGEGCLAGRAHPQACDLCDRGTNGLSRQIAPAPGRAGKSVSPRQAGLADRTGGDKWFGDRRGNRPGSPACLQVPNPLPSAAPGGGRGRAVKREPTTRSCSGIPAAERGNHAAQLPADPGQIRTIFSTSPPHCIHFASQFGDQRHGICLTNFETQLRLSTRKIVRSSGILTSRGAPIPNPQRIRH